MFRSKKGTTLQREVQALEEITERPNNNCADGVHCQRLAVEDELSGPLAAGWEVAAVLPSGKIMVKC